jgi:cyclopropane-fatty-acyl-phospholipid synthase
VSASLYLGRVWHARHTPLPHAFSYPVVFGCFDLDGLPWLNDLWPLAGYNRAAALAVRDRDYLGDAPGSVAEKWRRLWAGRPAAARVARVELLTVPRVLGYSYNPVNFYLGYEAAGALACAVAEINNTYGETHVYLLGEPLPAPPGYQAEFRAAKEFFVSPFFDLRGDYLFRFGKSPEGVDVRVVLSREGRPALSARLTGRAHPLTRATVASTLLAAPLAAALTMPRIAWQAWKLKRKGVRELLKPAPTSPRTIRRARRKAAAPRA